MVTRRSTALLALVTAAALVTPACSGSSSSSSPTTTSGTDASTTVAPTTAAPSTTTTTTLPPTTTTTTTTTTSTTTTTIAPTTTTTVPELDLTQFCVDSEQALLAIAAIGQIEDPTPDISRAALQFLVSAADIATASAPDGMEAQPARFAEISRLLQELFAKYNYDADLLDQNEDADEYDAVFDEYAMIVEEQLIPFLTQVCGTVPELLFIQATKLAAVVDQAVDWPFVPRTNEAGDIRLMAPDTWTETAGSPELGEETWLEVSPDVGAFENTWSVPGVRVQVFYVEQGAADPSLRVPSLPAAGDCPPIGSQPYADAVYSGKLFLYQSCAGTGTDAAVLAVTNAERSIEAYLEFQFPGGIDRPTIDRVLAVFAVGA